MFKIFIRTFIVGFILIASFIFFLFSLQAKETFQEKILRNKVQRCENREILNCDTKKQVCLCYDNKTEDECLRLKFKCLDEVSTICGLYNI